MSIESRLVELKMSIKSRTCRFMNDMTSLRVHTRKLDLVIVGSLHEHDNEVKNI